MASTDINNLFFRLKTDSGLEVEFCDKGASIYSIKYKDIFITYHPKDKKVFLSDNYHYGKTVGRIAGRVKDGMFKLEDKTYNLELNEVKKDEHNNKNNTLHSGYDSIHTKTFKHSISDLNDRYAITFHYLSQANESGFPESVDILVTYDLYKTQPRLDISINATPSGRTPLNFTNHSYFRLSNEGDIKNHYLTIPTGTMGKFNFADKNQVVIGKVSVVDDLEPFNFQIAKQIGQDVLKASSIDDCSNGYDHVWCTSDGSALATDDKPIILKNETTGIELKITTDANATVIYADCWPKTNMEMNPNGLDVQYGGVAIEPQSYWTKSTDNTIDENIVYSPQKPYCRKISYTLSRK